MDLGYFLIAGLAGFALLEFLFIPSLRRRLSLDRGMASVGRHALLATLQVLRTSLLITTLTTGLVLVVIFVVQLFDGATPEQVAATLMRLREARASIVSFSPVWGAFASVVLVAALVFAMHRRSRLRMLRTFKELFDRELDRLSQLYDKGELEPLPPSRELVQLAAKLAQGQELLAAIEREHAADQASLLVGEDGEPLPDDAEARTQRGAVRAKLAAQVAQQVGLLRAQHRAYDVVRRIELKLDPEAVETPPPANRAERIFGFFFSRGLLTSLNRVSRLLYVAAMALLIPALLVAYSHQVGRALDARIANLEQLRIELTTAQVDQQFAAAVDALSAPEVELAQADIEVIDQTARAFERSVARQLLRSVSPGALFNLRSSAVRDEVLSQLVKRSGGNLEDFASGSALDNMAPVERDLVAVAERTVVGEGDDVVLRSLREDLTRVARRSPGFVDRLRAELDSFTIPADSRDIGRALLGQVSSAIVDGPADSELGRYIERAIASADAHALDLVHQSQGRRFILGMLRGSDLEAALVTANASPEVGLMEPVMRTVVDRLPIEQANTMLRDFPPSVTDMPEPHVNVRAASNTIDDLSRALYANGNADTALADAMANFTDWFPPQLGADAQTPRGNLVRGWSPELPSAPTTRASFMRGRSFSLLRGFSRVGGVLIGRAPSDAAAPHQFVDMRWERSGNEVRFVLVDTAGREYRSPAYRAAVAYHALNYAADGRPLGATMVRAQPLPELKILLHPALVDTAMGYRIIELDRFVDTYVGSEDVERVQASQEVYALHALYELAWGQRVVALIDHLDAQSQLALLSEAATYRAAAERLLEDPIRAERAESILDDPSFLTDPTRSPLAAKPEFYDADLLAVMAKHATRGVSLNTFLGRIEADSAARLKSPLAEMRRWLSPPPEFTLWSGVRERPFSSDPAQLLGTGSAAHELPLSFMLQVAFTSPPNFLDNPNDAAGYSDENPWEFPAIARHIHESTLAGVAIDARARTILADAVEFTYLQRLFRAAFDGHLGADFPVEKLLALVPELEQSVSASKVRTPRWNNAMSAEQLELWLAQVAGTDKALADRLRDLHGDLGVERDAVRERSDALPPID